MNLVPRSIRFLVVLAGGGLALVVCLVLGRPADAADLPPPLDATADPNALVRVLPVMSELAADRPLRLAVSGAFEDVKPNATTKLFFATQAVYTGPVTAEGVEAIFARGRAHSLEHRLSPASLAQLCETLAQFDEALRDVSLLIEDERARVIELLRARADRLIVIRAQPAEADPEYLRLRVAQAEVSGGRGSVWEVLAEPDRHTHVVVKWTEWPALKAMVDDRVYMIEDRERRVGEWIKNTYRVQGLAMFAAPAGAPGRGGSPAARTNG
jgi:hypothetical protein